MNPSQLALANKAALEATGAFIVEPDGRVRLSQERGGGYVPPWVWAGAIPEASGNDAPSMALRQKLSTPGSDPSSPWHAMYQDGGPFTNRSTWDSEKGTYEGGIDWGTLLGTAAVGGLFAAPALGAAFSGAAPAAGASGSASAAGAGAAVPGALASTPIDAGLFTAPTVAPSGAVAAASGGGALAGKTGAAIKALATLGSAFGGRAIGQASQQGAIPPQLSQLLDLSLQQAQDAAPLVKAATQGKYQMLPTFARQDTASPARGLQDLLGVK
jgi:hypothetical protein